jgi:hypothetical protein
MHGKSGIGAVSVMNDRDDDIIQLTTEKFERRLAEECGGLRVDMANEFGKVRAEMQRGFGDMRVEMHQGFGAIRVEMGDRNNELLKWALVFGATQTAAIAGVVAMLR